MSDQFDTSFQKRDSIRRANHGKPWMRSEFAHLKELFKQGKSLESMCDELQRPAAGVLPKLVSMGLLRYLSGTNTYCHTGKSTTDQEEPEMTAETIKTIETKTFIRGKDASQMSDKQIFQEIAKIENEISGLMSIKAKSKKLEDYISSLVDDVVSLAKYVDNREVTV